MRQRSNSEGESPRLRIICTGKGKIQTLFIDNFLSFRMWIMINNGLDIWCNFSPPSPLYFKRLSFQPGILSFSLILLSFPHLQEKGFHKFKAFTDSTMTVTNPCFTTLSSLVILRTGSSANKLESTERSQRCLIWLPSLLFLCLCRTLDRLNVLWIQQKVSQYKEFRSPRKTLHNLKKKLAFPLEIVF